MGKEMSSQKIKLLKIWEILRQYSDEQNPLDTIQIIEKLKKLGISCERKTLYKDIDELNANGYKVYQKRSKRNLYYVKQSEFSVAELRILIDAVQSSIFITEKKTEELVEKIANLAGSFKADTLKNGVYFDIQKYKNEDIYNNIAKIDEAINSDRKVSFRYFTYDENAEISYKKDGARYKINPVALAFANDCYYLICFSDKHQSLSNYRVDRISDIEIEDERITHAQCAIEFDIAEYRRKTFAMYSSGKEVKVEIEFDKSLVSVMMDKFGTEVKIRGVGEGKCRLKAKVQISPVFFGWCATFGPKLRIISPASVAEEYKECLQKILETY